MATTSWTAVVSPSDAPPSLPAASPPISGRPTKTCLMGQRSLPWGCSWNSGWSSVAMTTGSFRKCVIFQMWHNHKMDQCTNTLQAVKMGACNVGAMVIFWCSKINSVKLFCCLPLPFPPLGSSWTYSQSQCPVCAPPAPADTP